MNYDKNEEKTETPTEHRIQKFRKKGKTKYSRELNSFFILFFGFIGLWWYRNVILFNFQAMMFDIFSFDYKTIIDEKKYFLQFFLCLKKIFFSLCPFFLFLLLVTTIPPIFLSGIKLKFQFLELNLKKLNLLSGLKRVFSIQIISEFFKIAIKLLLMISASFCCLWIYFSEIFILISEFSISAIFHGCKIISGCIFILILGLIPIVLFDIIWQQIIYLKKLKMTFKEVKDEFKEREGNPHIKIRIRQQMKENIRRRMIADIPKSDVVITNPIHYAVALQYDEKNMNAPKVIAKGVGEMAINIKNLALKNNISIISSPLLARSLYQYSEIGQYIPGFLYKAVAEVLAWVWRVRKWKKEGGVFPEKPKNILVPSELNFKGEQEDNG